jgi:hypothetical protein
MYSLMREFRTWVSSGGAAASSAYFVPRSGCKETRGYRSARSREAEQHARSFLATRWPYNAVIAICCQAYVCVQHLVNLGTDCSAQLVGDTSRLQRLAQRWIEKEPGNTAMKSVSRTKTTMASQRKRKRRRACNQPALISAYDAAILR